MTFLIFHHCQNTHKLLNITPVKYEYDWKNPTCTFLRSNLLLVWPGFCPPPPSQKPSTAVRIMQIYYIYWNTKKIICGFIVIGAFILYTYPISSCSFHWNRHKDMHLMGSVPVNWPYGDMEKIVRQLTTAKHNEVCIMFIVYEIYSQLSIYRGLA